MGRTDGRTIVGTGRGFSLVELLIVIFIIALVMAIVVPALGGARNVARAAAAQQLLTEFSTAAGSFERDKRRPPGVFTPEQMGDPQNDQRGMSAMENALIDLTWSAAIKKFPGQPAGPGGLGTLRAGPLIGGINEVDLDEAKMGLATDQIDVYFTPDPKYLVAQLGSEGQQVGVYPHTGDRDRAQLPDLVDPWGQPILLWMDNEQAGEVRGETPSSVSGTGAAFAAGDSGDAAHFYWLSNAAFLKATSLGKLGEDQTDSTRGSLIGGASFQDNMARSMGAILGHPSYPDQNRNYPTTGRGRMVLHSAGPDGVYFGRKDKRAKAFTSTGVLKYRFDFFDPVSDTPYTSDSGEAETIDVIEKFDDVLVTGG